MTAGGGKAEKPCWWECFWYLCNLATQDHFAEDDVEWKQWVKRLSPSMYVTLAGDGGLGSVLAIWWEGIHISRCSQLHEVASMHSHPFSGFMLIFLVRTIWKRSVVGVWRLSYWFARNWKIPISGYLTPSSSLGLFILWPLVRFEKFPTMTSKGFFPENVWHGMRVDLGNQHESSTWELGDKLSEEIHQKSETRYRQKAFPSVAHGTFHCRNVNSHEQARMKIFMQ